MLEPQHLTDLRLLNPMTLAFVGDGVYEMLAREEVVRRYTSLSADRLHRRTVELVRASAQAIAFAVIEPLLTEAELAVFKRGRNSNGVTPPRHSSAAEYRTATGLEALFGWLYLAGENQRIHALFQAILNAEPDFVKQDGALDKALDRKLDRKLDGAEHGMADKSDNRAATLSEV